MGSGTRTGWNGLVAVMLAAVFSLTLAGCGGGSSTTQAPMMDTSLADAKAAAMAAYEAAKKALDDVMANKDADMSAYNSAAAQVAAAKAASDQAAAAETVAAAQLAQRLAERARAEAERYAGVVTAAHAAAQLQMAKDAAKAAYEAAKKALDDVMADKDADMASYDTAAEKVDAAKAAADEAAAAETLADAQAAKEEAEKAQADAEKYTNMVKSASDVAAKIAEVKKAAMKAYTDAKKALDDVMEGKDADMDSYDTAARKVAVAKAASDKAQETETLEAAQAAKELAETAKTEAEKYTGMVMKAHAAAQLKDAKAMAMKAYEDAKKALDDVMDIKDADKMSYDTATEKVAAAKAANDKAQKAESLADAQAAQKEAEDARDEAQQYAGMVRDKQMAADEMKLKAAITKGALAFEKDIDTSPIITFDATRFGWRDTEPAPAISRDSTNGFYAGYDPSQKLKEAELPAVLNDLGGGFQGKVHVRTTEDETKGETVREKSYYFNNMEVATVGTGGSRVDDQYWVGFGFWTKETEKDGVTTYNHVQASNYSDPASSSGTRVTKTERKLIEGEATYMGPAAGAYVHKTVKADGTLDAATAGLFAADVNLTAKFGGDDIPVSKKFTISGAISNFRLSGGQANNWNLKIEAEDLNKAGNSEAGTFGGTTDGGKKAGDFYGIFIDDRTSYGARGTDAKTVPGSVMGRFKGFFLNGSVHGGFGATKEE